jgi:spermidine/putrescine transport system substrate-binding protein
MGRAIAILLLLLLAACAPATPSAAPTVTAVAGGSTLRIFNWDTYIDPALIAEFETATGARVVYSTYASSEELLGAVQADPTAYDLVMPSDYMVEVMRRERLLAPLDKANIPNLVNLDPLFASPAYDPANRYCVPYLWGTVGLGYSSGAVAGPIIGWADIFERRSGSVAILDDSRVMLGAALLVLGHSPNTTDPRTIAAARDYLLERAGNFDAVAPDTGQDLLAAGTVDLAVEWSGDIFQVSAEHGDLQYVIPAEGSIIWTDNMCILAGSPNDALAEQFINFILEPRVGAALANYTRFSTPNRAALPWVRPEDLANPALYPDQRTRERLFFLVDVGPEAADLYTRSWAEVLAAVP